MAAVKKLKRTEAVHLINSIQTFFFDCDGVLWNAQGAIPGAMELIKRLKNLKKTLFFVTNNSASSRQGCVHKFKKYGLAVSPEEILPTSYLVARYAKKILNLNKIYMIGSQGMKEEFENEGLQYIGFGPQPPKDNPNVHYTLNFDTTVDPEVQAVIVGWDPDFNLNKVSQAMAYLQNKDIPFISTNTDSCFPVGNGTYTPGTGTLVKAVEFASSRQSRVLGKPNKELFEVAQTMADIDPATTLMIGDRLNTDIEFGKNCGMKTLCVLSGVTQIHELEEMLKDRPEHEYPDHVADSIHDLFVGTEDI